jgi:hypothetical protein
MMLRISLFGQLDDDDDDDADNRPVWPTWAAGSLSGT